MSKIDVLVRRAGTEGLSMASYAELLRERLPDQRVVHARTPDEERSAIASARVVTGLQIETELLERAEELELFACIAAGVDHLALEELDARGVTVTNASGIHAAGIAEQILGFMLVFARNLHVGWQQKRRGEWRHFQSRELTNSTITIFGLGAIGTALVKRLQGMDVETIGVRRTTEKGGPTDEVIGYDSADVHDALARSDYVVLACPLTETTHKLIDESAFKTMEPHCVVINVSRGGVIDTDDLVTALQTNAIRGAALDVTDPEPLPGDHPLWSLENALLTPHTGGHTPMHWPRLADILARNVPRLDTDEELENCISSPSN